MHFVRLGLQVLKETFDTEPLLIPLPGPVGRAVDHPLFVRLTEFVPRGIARNTRHFGMPHQIVLCLLPRGRLHGLDGARTQTQFLVWNDQTVIDTDHAAKTPAGLTRANR